MLIQQIIGTLQSIPHNGRTIDWLHLEWYEANKRIQRKRTASGQDIALRLTGLDKQAATDSNRTALLTQDDVLYEDAHTLIAVSILPCDTLVVTPGNMYEMASVCYEIGNKHLPLFYEADSLLAPYEAPLHNMLSAAGFNVTRESRKLLQPLRTTVAPHGHGAGSPSLFSRILQLTSPSSHE
ncbi:MAG: urease accessory protein UreE [Bacteroidetes bacterium]|nr:urease accessory protein UreE [Bacteroidota bacterium]